MTKHYLSNKDLYYEIIVSKAQGKLTRKAEKMILLLSNNVFRKFSYYDYKDYQDCRQESLLHIFKGWYNFDENKTDNAFAYFTQIIKIGAAQGFKNIYKMDYKTGEYYDKPVPFSRLFEEGGEINL